MTCTDALSGPFAEEWIMSRTGSTAAELAVALADHDTETLAAWHDDLAHAVNELHRDRICAESDPTAHRLDGVWSTGDPIVALVRAVASLARRRPDARSSTARLLVDVLDPRNADQSPWAS